MTIIPPIEITKLVYFSKGTVLIDKKASEHQLSIFKEFKKEFDKAIKENKYF